MCMNSALLASQQSQETFFYYFLFAINAKLGSEKLLQTILFHWILHKAYVFLLEMFFITESITRCNLDDNHT